MKSLNNSLFKKFEPNKINNLTKVIGGAPQNSKWESDQCHCCGWDTIDVKTGNGPTVILNGNPVQCDFEVCADPTPFTVVPM